MRKKVIALALSAVLFALCSSVEAQQAEKVPRIGILAPGSSALPTSPAYHDSFRQGLRDLGYIEGKNILIEIDMQKGSKIGFLILLPNW